MIEVGAGAVGRFGFGGTESEQQVRDADNQPVQTPAPFADRIP